MSKCFSLNFFEWVEFSIVGSSRESDQVPQRVDTGDLSGQVSSVVKPIQCSSGYGTVTEVVPSCSSSSQQSPVNVVVRGAGTRACMNNATGGNQVNEETLNSQNEVIFWS